MVIKLFSHCNIVVVHNISNHKYHDNVYAAVIIASRCEFISLGSLGQLFDKSRPNKASLKYPSIRTYVHTYVRTYVGVRTSVRPQKFL